MQYSSLKKLAFTSSQYERLSNIFDNAGQGFLVVLVLTQVVVPVDRPDSTVIVLGTIAVLLCWTASLILARGKDK